MTNYTSDGVPIVEGLKVWDNNLDLVAVGTQDRIQKDWYYMFRPDGSEGHIMNGERMSTVHPGTRQSASDAWPNHEAHRFDSW